MDYKEQKRQVPFGNSAFQILNFTAKQDGVARSYRHILLQLDSKQKAMKECYFNRKRIEIDLDEIDHKLKTFTGFEHQRLLIDREEKEGNLESELKLIEDCAIEIKIYEKALSKLPEFTREEFEVEEQSYWKTRFLKQAQLELKSNNSISVGILESLQKIGCAVEKDESGKHIIIDNTKQQEEITENIKEIKEDLCLISNINSIE